MLLIFAILLILALRANPITKLLSKSQPESCCCKVLTWKHAHFPIKYLVVRVLSTGRGGGGGGEKLTPRKVFLKKKLKLFQIKIFFDDDFKESVKVANVQKCDYSQS